MSDEDDDVIGSELDRSLPAAVEFELDRIAATPKPKPPIEGKVVEKEDDRYKPADDLIVILYRQGAGEAFDVTDEFRTMYDAVVGSMDWGSGFLDTDEVRALQRIQRLASFPPDSADNSDVDVCVHCGHRPHRDSKCYHGATSSWQGSRLTMDETTRCRCENYERKED